MKKKRLVLSENFKKGIYLFNSGQYFDAYDTFGSQKEIYDGQEGYRLTLWAPQAQGVSIVSDFTNWNQGEALYPVESTGVWTAFFKDAQEEDHYKFKIVQADGKIALKQDPFAFKYEVRPKDASVIKSIPKKQWEDSQWIKVVE